MNRGDEASQYTMMQDDTFALVQNTIIDDRTKTCYRQTEMEGEIIREQIFAAVQEQTVDTNKMKINPEIKKIEVEMEFDDFQSQQPLSPSKIFSATGPQYRKKQSKVWTYFEKSSDGSTVICNCCGEVQRFMSNTTNMIRHIEKVHSNKEKSNPSHSQPVRRIKQLRRRVCQRSPVWNYFHRIAHLNKVQCKLCLENYSYSGNTTNLRFHMRTRHADVYDKIDDELTGKEVKVNEKQYENVDVEYPVKRGTKKVNIEMVVDKLSETKAETISVEVCTLE